MDDISWIKLYVVGIIVYVFGYFIPETTYTPIPIAGLVMVAISAGAILFKFYKSDMITNVIPADIHPIEITDELMGQYMKKLNRIRILQP